MLVGVGFCSARHDPVQPGFDIVVGEDGHFRHGTHSKFPQIGKELCESCKGDSVAPMPDWHAMQTRHMFCGIKSYPDLFLPWGHLNAQDALRCAMGSL